MSALMPEYTITVSAGGEQCEIRIRQVSARSWEARGKYKSFVNFAKANSNRGVIEQWKKNVRVHQWITDT